MASAADSEFQQMLDDCHAQFGETVTLTIITAGAFNTATQTRARTTVNTTVTAIRSERRIDPMVGGGMSVEETIYRIRRDVTGFSSNQTVEPGSLLIDGHTTYKVHRVEHAVNDMELVLYCREHPKQPPDS